MKLPIDQAELHAQERARETAGDYYRHAPLPYCFTREGQAERDRARARVQVKRLVEGDKVKRS